MLQFPVNLNDATTGHKLQGMSKDVPIVTLCPTKKVFENRVYVVLSRIRKLDGLYLLEPIDMKHSFQPLKELQPFFKQAHRKEENFLNKRERRLEKLKK